MTARILQVVAAAAGVATAFLATAALRNGAILPPRLPDGYAAVSAPHYTLYAPEGDALGEGDAELRYAVQRFRHHFGGDPSPLVVVLADDPEDFDRLGLAALRRPGVGFLPFLTGAHRGSGRDAALDPRAAEILLETRTLAHEACHGFVSGYAEGLATPRSAGPAGYGHGALPDWLDEMAAVFCEGEPSRRRRRELLRQRRDDLIPVAVLVRMEHPLATERIAKALEEVAGPGTGPVQVIAGPELQRVLEGTRADLFYAQALSLGEFLFERGGQEGMKALVRALAGGHDMDAALRSAAAGGARVPPSVEALERAWLAWLDGGGGAR